jgi:hypothetical protein
MQAGRWTGCRPALHLYGHAHLSVADCEPHLTKIADERFRENIITQLSQQTDT